MVNSVIKKVDTINISIWGVLRLAHSPVESLFSVSAVSMASVAVAACIIVFMECW